jgi:hypothetical protein
MQFGGCRKVLRYLFHPSGTFAITHDNFIPLLEVFPIGFYIQCCVGFLYFQVLVDIIQDGASLFFLSIYHALAMLPVV